MTKRPFRTIALLAQFVSAAALLIVALTANQVQAQVNGTWTSTAGAGNGLWNSAGNWVGGVLPTGGTTTTLTFGATSGTTILQQNLGSPFQLNSLRFDRGTGGAYTLTGGAFVFNGTNANITFTVVGSGNAVIAQTINNNIILGAGGLTLNVSGTNLNVLRLTGSSLTTTAVGNVTLTLAGTSAGTGTLGNAIFNSITDGSGTLSIVKNGTGAWSLFGDNSFSGQVSIQAGTLTVNSLTDAGMNSSLGVGSSINFGTAGSTGTLSLTGTGPTSFQMNRSIVLTGTTGGGVIANNITDSTGTLLLQGNVVVSSSGRKALVLAGTNVGINVLASTLSNGSGTLGLQKSGAGTWSVQNAANSFNGGVTVAGGTLRTFAAGSPFGGINGTNNNIIFGGANGVVNVIETRGTITNNLGSAVNQIQWRNAASNAAGGFSAEGGTLGVLLNAAGNTNLVWGGTTGFVATGSELIFGSATADNVVTFSNNIDLGGAARTLRVFDNATTTNDGVVMAGNLSGVGGGLLITGNTNGRIVMAGTNTYSGGTTLGVATEVVVRNNSSLGSGPITVTAGFLSSDLNPVTLNNDLNLRGNMIFGGSQTLTISGTTALLGASRLITANNSAGVFLNNLTIADSTVNRGLLIAGSGIIQINGVISNGGTATSSTVNITNTGGVIFANNNTYTGTTVIGANARLTLGAGGATGMISNTINVLAGGRLVFNRSTIIGYGTSASQRIFGAGGVEINSPAGGGLRFMTPQSYTGGTTVTSGLWDLNGVSTTVSVLGGSAGGVISNSTGTALLLTVTSGNFGGVIAGANIGLVKTGTAGILTLGGANTFSAQSTLIDGTLVVGNNGALGLGQWTVLSGTISATGSTRTLTNNLTLTGDLTIGGSTGLILNGQLTNSATTSIITVTNTGLTQFQNIVLSQSLTAGGTLGLSIYGNTIINGVISNGTGTGVGTLNVDLFNNSTLTFGGNNTYTGLTTISGAGKAVIAPGVTFGQNTILVEGGANLAVNGITSSSAPINLNGGVLSGTGNVLGSVFSAYSIIAPGNAGVNNGIGRLTVETLGLTGGVIELQLGAPTDSNLSDQLVINGAAPIIFGTTSVVLDLQAATGLTYGDYTVLSGYGSDQLSNNTMAKLLYNIPIGFDSNIAINGYVQNNQGSLVITLAQAPGQQLTWTGAANNGLWDGTSVNWKINGTNTATTYNAGTFDDARFVDLPTDQTIQLVSGLSPNTLYFENSTATTYTFLGVNGFSASGLSLVKTGNGMVTLATNNNYGGFTKIQAGTLQIGNGGADGFIASPLIVNDGTLIYNLGVDYNHSATILGSGQLVKTGTGRMVMTDASNLYSGGTQILAGTLRLEGITTLPISGAVNVISGTLDISSLVDQRIPSVTVSNGGQLIFSGNGVASITNLAVQSGTLTTGGNLRYTNMQLGGGGPGTTSVLTISDGGTQILTNFSYVASGTTSDPNGALITGSGILGFNGARTINVADSFNAEFDLTITNTIDLASSFNKTGLGSLYLQGVNLSTSNNTITAGTVVVGNNLAFGSGLLTVTNGGLRADATARTLTNTIVISGTLTISGTADLSIVSTTTGVLSGTVINQGGNRSLIVNNTGMTTIEQLRLNDTTSNNRLLTIGGSGRLTVTNMFDVTTTGGSGAVLVDGSGLRLILPNASPYTGTTAIRDGYAFIGAINSLGSSASTIDLGESAGLIDAGLFTTAAMTFTRALNVLDGTEGAIVTIGSSAPVTTTFSGAISLGQDLRVASVASGTTILTGVVSGTGGITKTGAGLGLLTNNNSYTGITRVYQGTLRGSSQASFGTRAGLDVDLGAVFDRNNLNLTFTSLNDGPNGGGLIMSSVAGAMTLTIADGAFSGVIQDATGGGVLTFVKNSTGTLILSGNNTFSGTTTILDGTLQLGIGGTSGQIASTTIRNFGTLIVNRSDTVVYPGIVSGTGAVQINSGIVVLTNTHTYSGATSLAGGSLTVNGALGASAVSIGDGSTLDGSGAIGGSVNVTDGGTLGGTLNVAGAVTSLGTLEPGNSGTAGTLQLASLILGGGSLNFDLGTIGAGSDHITLGSGATLTISGATAFNFNALAGLGNGTYSLISGFTGTLANFGLLSAPLTLSGFNISLQNNSGSLDLLVQTLVTNNLVWTGSSSNWDTTTSSWTPVSTFTQGDLVTFNDTATTFSVNVAAASVSPAGMTVNAAVTYTFNGNPIVSATLSKSGTGLVTFLNNVTFTTGATVTSGTLQIGNGGSSGSFTGNIANDAAVIFNHTAAVYGGIISGTGTVSILGTATTFTNDQAYTGQTLIGAGATLNLGIGAGSGNLTGDVTNSGILRFNRSGSATYGGAIGGLGAVSIAAGDLIFTGNSTYTGITTIASGASLSLGSGGATGSITGSVVNSGTLNFNRNATYGYDGIVSGAGTVSVQSGTLTFSQLQAYAGLTTIASGANLILGGANGNLTGSVVNNGVLTLSHNLIYNGVISGLGGVAVTTGSSTLTGSNTYANVTTISSGATLNLGNGGATGSITGSVVNSGTLNFNRSGISSYDGIVSGTGSVGLITGTLTFSQLQTYSGLTTISSGANLILGGAAGNLTGSVVNNGVLTLSRNLAYNGQISGVGALAVTTGSATLGGNNTFSGITTIASGVTLNLGTGGANGSITGSVANGGILNFNRNAAYGYDGIISGAGTVGVQSGTLTFSQLQSYTGITTISSGANLILGGAAGNLTGSVVNNGVLTLSRNLAYNGQISGGGSLLVTTGSATLGNVNTYTGPTTINVGATLNLGSGGSITSDVANSGLLTFQVGAVSPFNNVIIGAGEVSLAAGAIMTFNALQTYTGVTTIGAGANLTLANSGNLTGSVSNGGVLTINHTLTYGGRISGAGGVQINTGVTTFTNDNSYAGITTLAVGTTLNLGIGGASGSITGSVANSGILNFNRNAAYSYDGIISGAGTVGVQSGTLTFSQLQTYAGLTTIASGANLILGGANGNLTGSVVNNGVLTLSRNLAYGGVISGLGGVAVTTGSATLTGSNTYANVTTISSGATLNLGSGGATGSITGSVANAGTLNFNRNATYGYDGVVSGAGTVGLQTGTLTFSQLQTYSGLTTINSGANLILGGPAGNLSGSVVNNGVLTLSRNLLYGGQITGVGSVAVTTGSVTLTGGNTYANVTTISSGATLNLGTGGATGSITGSVANAGTLNFNRNATYSYDGIVSGGGGVGIQTGTVTFSQLQSYSGPTTISSGANLILGGANGNLAGNVANSGVLTFSRTLTYNGQISGNGTVAVNSGTTTLGGNNSYTGPTQVTGGGLVVSGTLGATAVSVASGASLSGAGTIGGTVNLAANATLAGTLTVNSAVTSLGSINPGGLGTVGTLQLSSLILNGGTLNFDLASIGASDKIILGSLAPTVNGATAFNFSNLLGFTTGTYSLMSGYSGALSGFGNLSINALSGYTLSLFNNNGSLDLFVSLAPSNLVWTGTSNATWDTTSINWSGSSTTFTNNQSFVQFDNTSNVNTITVTAAGVSPLGMTVDNDLAHTYLFNGGAITSTGLLTKNGVGTLILANNVTFSNGATVSNGTLQIGNGGNTGLFTGNITNNAVVAFNRTDASSYDGVISGTGAMSLISGTLTFSQLQTYSGLTTISSGANLILGGAAGNLSGSVVNNGVLTLSRNLQYNGTISGVGALAVTTGSATLGGNNTYAGITTIASGVTLNLGTGGANGSITGSVANSGILNFNRNAAYSYDGIISGAGTVGVQSGTLTFSQLQSYTGITTISSGANLILGGAAGNLTGSVVNNGVLTLSHNLIYGGVISGLGGVAVTTGSATLTGSNTFAGVTTVSSGAILNLGNGGATGSITGSVANDGTLNFNRNAAYGYDGIVSGAGTVGLQTGTLTFSQLQTYSGLTTIASGANLILGGSAGNLSGSLVNNGVLTLSRNLAYNGQISGLGALAVTTGSATLGGDNTYAGITTIASGVTLNLGTGGANGSITGSVANAGVLNFNRNAAYSYDGVVSGAGTVGVQSGTLSFSQLQTYAGLTTISSGANLILGGAAGNLTGSIVNNGLLTLSRSLLYGGQISGLGSLAVTTGSAALTGDNTYGGPTTISSGATLNLGNGGATGSVIGNVVNGGTLNFNRNATYNYGGVISGVGNVQFLNGTVTLTGANTYSGDTSVIAGNVIVSGGTLGTLTSDITVGTTSTGGSLTVTAGGLVNADNLHVGFNSASVGALIVSGSSSSLVSNELHVGRVGTGSMYISDGAVVTSGGGSRSYIGEYAGSVGTVTISGANSRWFHNNGDIEVGALGTGALTLTAGGRGTGDLFIGEYATGIGNVLVDGVGSQWSSTNSGLFVGAAGTGTLRIQNGGVVIASSAAVGQTVGGNGSVNISGANSRWSVTNALYVGGNQSAAGGSGTITVTGGGALNVGGLTQLWQAGSAMTVGIGGTFTSGSLSGTGDIVNDGSLVVGADNSTRTYAGFLSGVGSFSKLGTGNLILTGDNTFSGLTSLVSGTLQIGNGGSTGAIAGNIANNSSLLFNRTGTLNYNGQISGTGAVTTLGGTLVFGSNNSYTGATSVAGGNLIVNGTLGATAVSVGSGASLSGAGTIGGTVNLAANATLAGTLTVNSAVTSLGSINPGGLGTVGTLQLSSLILNGGTLNFDLASIGASDKIILGSLAPTVNGATAFNFSNLLGFGAGTYNLITGYTGTLSGLNFGNLSINSIGGYTLTLQNNSGSLDLLVGTVANNISWTGGSGSWDYSTPNFSGTDGLFRNGDFVTFGDNNLAATVTVTSSGVLPGSTTINNDGNSPYAFTGGAISGTGPLYKLGNGSVTFSNVNNYSGGTSVLGGSFIVGSGGSITNSGNINVAGSTLTVVTGGSIVGGGQTFVNAGGTVVGNGAVNGLVTINNGGLYKGSGGTVGAIVVNSGGTLSPGGSVGILTINGVGVVGGPSLTLNAGANIQFEFNDVDAGPGLGWDYIELGAGLLTINAGNQSAGDFVNVYVNSLDLLNVHGAADGFNAAPGTPGNIQQYFWKFIGLNSLAQISTTGPSSIGGRFNVIDDALNAGVFDIADGNPFNRPISSLGQGTFKVLAGNFGGQGNGLYLVYSAVPEPGSMILAGLGSLAAGWYGRRRLRKQTADAATVDPLVADLAPSVNPIDSAPNA